ncbi:regulator of G-protein signaling 21-like isoform X1 [Pungitius pungitius]|uniref:regulator of G-protein signaling 21-like isoform X1 n=1 Tax=Pungitius pungitius TaxID=134920 RepID=UPI001887A667|nr:regulator of G-protein signaling 21-like isoform X1 [Pungitius pungitius]
MSKCLFSKTRFSKMKDMWQTLKHPKRIDIIHNQSVSKKDFQSFIGERINDDTYPSKLSWQLDDELQPTEIMLHDKKYLAAFRCFLKTEFSEENIDFWFACEEFKSTASPEDLPWKAWEIYQEFIQPAAPREINVDHHIKEKIKRSLEKPSLSSFDEAQKHVYLLMERDSCPRFLHSEAYRSLKYKSKTRWYI